MTSRKISADKATELRRLAEEQLKERERRRVQRPEEDGAPTEAQRLIQELQIHQIELEMQNEALKTSRTEMERLLNQYTDLYDFAPVGYCTIDHEGTIFRMNLIGSQLLGKERTKLLKQSFKNFVSEADRPVFNRFLQEVFTKRDDASGKASCEVTLCNQQGHPSLFESSGGRQIAEATRYHVYIRAQATEGGPECHVIIMDITERKRMEETLRESEKRYRELSIVDDLTQLYNSRHFYHQLMMEINRSDRYGQPLTLMLLDLDDFKQFNDTFGHIEGDQVLLRLGRVIKRCLRQTDTAYRYGGEEFTILLPLTQGKDSAITAERIRMEFKKETFSPAPDQDVHVTLSIGHAQYKPREDMKVFVQRVDQLMYQAKKEGKDRVCSES